jgi:DNA-binding transcriptional LysR family regulator
MSFAQLQSFVVVAEEQHLTRAARRLHISQPPLSRQIRELEGELGVQLFERTPKGMKLLPPGHALLTRAREILRLVQEARGAVVSPLRDPTAGITPKT